MYQQQSGVGGGMLKRHFTMIYSQLDELREQMARVESNIADLALRMQEINRQYTALESSRNQISETTKTSQELTSAVESLKRDINSLRARFESELLSIGDPINSRGAPSVGAPVTAPTIVQTPVETPKPQIQPEPETLKPIETPQTQTEETPAPAAPAPEEQVEQPVEQPKQEAEAEPSSDKTYSPTVKSLEEQLGLVPPSDATDQQTGEKQGKPEEKKKRRFF